MPQLKPASSSSLKLSAEMSPAEPLWKRAPTHDDEGHKLSDFMMIIPRLGKQPADTIKRTLSEINAVLTAYEHAVVFADMNLKLNTLWVTVRPIPGICLELPTAVKARVPEALLVAHKHE